MLRLIGIALLCSLLLIPIYIFYLLFKHVFDDVSLAVSSSSKATRNARVIGKRQESLNRKTVPFVTFEFNDGTRKELMVFNGDYGILQKGDIGAVRYSGRYYKGFDRNLNHAHTQKYSNVSGRGSTHNSQQSKDKLQLGLQRLSKAGNDSDLLGLALISLHGALEDCFRNMLASNSSVPPSAREVIYDSRQVQWKSLLDLMQQYGGLNNDLRQYIFRMNRLRQEVGHGNLFTGTRSELEKYADFVRGFVTNGFS